MGLFKEELRSIKAFVFDVDGVLAESRVVLHPSGDMMRTMNTKDGYAMYKAMKEGFPIAIISGAKSPSIIGRFFNLGIEDVYLDSKNKSIDLDDFLSKYDLDASFVLYMGDDIPDIAPMREVGLPTCPNDAVEEVQGISKYISNLSGGKGCVRDIVEQVLRAQGKWSAIE
jgi:3-deoxy-D-manno-octulosonate 8-phosphate phosphatase (KDO 8-P phosphatase)